MFFDENKNEVRNIYYMNILLFSSAPAVSGRRSGGSIVWCQVFLKMLRKRGHDVFTVTYGDSCEVCDCDEFKENLYFVQNDSKFAWLDSTFSAPFFRMVNVTKKARAIAKTNAIDIIITSSIHEAGGFSLSGNACPVIAVCHGYYPYELRVWNSGKKRYISLAIYWLLEQLGKLKAKSIICPSNWLKNRLANRLRGKELIVIKNMLRKEPLMQHGYSLETLGLKNNATTIISYNVMTAPFNHESFFIYLETAKKILSKNDKIQFILFGVSEGKFDFIVKSVKDLPIKVLGTIENVFELLRLSDIFLHISLIDTFSMSTLEAMSVGLPVVVTNQGALPELVEDNKTGLLANLDPDEIANAALSLITDSEKAAILGNNAKVFAGEFGEDKIGKIWEEFLVTAINKAKN